MVAGTLGSKVLFSAYSLRSPRVSTDGFSMKSHPARAMLKSAFLFIIMAFSFGAASAQKARQPLDAGTSPNLPNTMDVTPSRGVGPFDAKQAQEWRDAAETLSAQSRYGEAEKLYVKLLEEREHALGLNSPELAIDMSDLGRVTFAQAKYNQAIAYYERYLQIMETSKGRQDFEVVTPLSKLIQVNREVQKYSEAERYARRAATIAEAAKGPESPELAAALIVWADLLKAQKQYAPAEQQYGRAVKIYEKSIGAAASDMLPALDGLGETYIEMRRPNDTETSWRRALSIRESAFGSSSIEVGETLDRLGKFYFDQKKYPEAAYCYERTLFIRAKVHGDQAPDTQATLTQVASVYGAQGRHDDAEPLFRQMLSAKESELVSSVNSLAALMANREKNGEAESLYKISITVLDKKGFVTARKPVLNPSDPPSPLLAETLDQYAALLKKMRKRSDAARIEARARMLHGLEVKPSASAQASANTGGMGSSAVGGNKIR